MQGSSPTSLTDEELLRELKRLVAQERENTVAVLRHLAEVDTRRTHEKAAFPSLFVYCVRELGYAEGAAYRRIRAARCARDFPRVYAFLKQGRVSLTTVSLLAPHMCRENYRQLLEQAAGKTRYEVERLLAALVPQRETRDSIRPLGQSQSADGGMSRPGGVPMQDDWFASPPQDAEGGGVSAAPGAGGRTAAVPDFVPRRVEFRFAADETLLGKIRRAQEVLWHKYPGGRLEDIVDEGMEALLDRRDPERRLARLARRRESKAPG